MDRPPHTAAPEHLSAPARDQLATEVRDSVLLLLLSVLTTAGVAAAASALLAVLS